MSKTIAIVVVVVVVLGGLYLWNRGGQNGAPSVGNSSDSLSTIESDLQNLSVDDVGKDIDPL